MRKFLETRPAVFIGFSSDNGQKIADAIQANLDSDFALVPWNQADHPSAYVLETLTAHLDSSDFAVFVLTPDDFLVSRETEYWAPRDNVLLEIGLFIGGIGRERTFVVCDKNSNLKLPSDLSGLTRLEFQIHDGGNVRASIGGVTARIKETVSNLGPRNVQRGCFALCIPAKDAADDDFSHWLKYYLMEKLVSEGIRLVEYCPKIEEKDSNTLWNFRDQVAKLRTLAEKEPLSFLLAIWPALRKDNNQTVVLDYLRPIVRNGCRIAFINEYPEIPPSDKDFIGKVFSIRVDEKNAINLLCREIARYAGQGGPVLLINANQSFQVAQKRKKLYEEALRHQGIQFTSRVIHTWQGADAYALVLEELQQLEGTPGAQQFSVIAAANDDMAMGALNALQDYCTRRDFVLPTKVVGFDGLPDAMKIIDDPASNFVATLSANPKAYATYAFEILCKDQTSDAGPEILIPIDDDDLRRKNKC